MEKLKSSFLNILMSLTGICLIAGVALSAANKYTESAIAASKAAELRNAIQKVTPAFDNNPVEEQFRAAISERDSLTVYPVRIKGQWVGNAVESYTKNGFSGLIRVMVGFDAESKLVNYAVLEHNETPGLGSKMEEWFRKDKNRQNIIGRDMKNGELRTTKDGGDVDAITAATISTRAFLEAINLAFIAFKGNTDAVSGATTGNSAGDDASNNKTNNDSITEAEKEIISIEVN